MATITPDDYHSFELHFERAFGVLLKNSQFNVCSPFVRVVGERPDGSPELAPVPDDACFILANYLGSDDSVLKTLPDFEDGDTSEDAGETIKLSLIHRVPIDDRPDVLPTYERLCRQRGRLRALVRNGWKHIQRALPIYDLLSISIAAEPLTTDQQKLAHQATEIVTIRYTAHDELPN